MAREEFPWSGLYTLRDGTKTIKRSQGAYDAQKKGLFPIEEATTYISRALKISEEEARDMLIGHRKTRLRQPGSIGDEWHHVGPAGRWTSYFDARELAVWRKLDNADLNWMRKIYEQEIRDSSRPPDANVSRVSEIKRLSEATNLKEEKIWDAFWKNMRLRGERYLRGMNSKDRVTFSKLDEADPTWFRNMTGANSSDDTRASEIKRLSEVTGLRADEVLHAYNEALRFVTSTARDEWRTQKGEDHE